MPKKISPIRERFQCTDCGKMHDEGVRRVYGIGWDDNCLDCFLGWVRRRLVVTREESELAEAVIEASHWDRLSAAFRIAQEKAHRLLSRGMEEPKP